MKTRAKAQVKRSPRVAGRGAKGTIGIPYAVGFGFGFASTPIVEPDGARLIHYRYLPPAIWRLLAPDVIGALNSAAAFGCRGEDIPLYAIRADAEPAETLTEAGQALFDRLPIYGILRAQEPYLEWTQFLPDGNEAHTARSPHIDVVIGEAQKMWPMNHWAKKFLEPWEHRLSPHAELGKVAMLLVKPMEGDLPDSKRSQERPPDDPGWSSKGGFDFPRAAHT